MQWQARGVKSPEQIHQLPAATIFDHVLRHADLPQLLLQLRHLHTPQVSIGACQLALLLLDSLVSHTLQCVTAWCPIPKL